MISLKNVDFIYNNAKADIGVHQIDLEISKGEVVLLCGSSGCGKTTLTRMINGFAYCYQQNHEPAVEI